MSKQTPAKPQANPQAKPHKQNSGYYWVDKKITCNGCKFLNFYKCGCRRNQPPGQVRPLSSYTNGDNYKAILKPSDCDYQKDQANPEKKGGATDGAQEANRDNS